ncbi:MAG: YYY membrane protein [Candidatus Woesebacteria bacterium GW2011_GWA1_39_21]|uniref:YYY membrane protein n=1 Tax=Candidatus Woesebacteria bacterium GW2011_GWA1_39_21 TaxID=1618550 RepID=A0A0G0QMV0_9BACT|nr:MAG: YYY membrane protein [Candidatus Woesebacteria bacterium GW2011_GWA1_39_21]
MFINDLPNILKWWGYLFIIGVTFFPLTWFVFKKFFGVGYTLSKTLGIILLSYTTFLFATLHIAKFSAFNILLYLVVFLALNLYIAFRNKQPFLSDMKKNLLRIVLQEFIFAFGLFLWSFVRAHQPEIRGLEKFMDFGFVNSALGSDYLPPHDMWAAGYTINYYWFGHFVTALLAKLTNIPSEITYNLMLATIMGLILSSAVVITSTLFEHISKNIRGRYVFLAGIISALILVFAGNFHTPFYILKNGVDNYWYPDATRFIGYNPETNDKTIHEFPMYSFVVADLHGHLLNLPFVLLFLAFAFKLVSDKEKNSFKIKNLILPGVLLGIMFMTSTWDFGNYLLTLGFVLLYSSVKDNHYRLVNVFVEVAKILIITISIGVATALPFITHFESIAQGINFVHGHSPLWQLAILWGFPAVLTVVFANILKKLGKKLTTSDLFVLSLLTSSWVLILLPEIIYVKDIYAATHYRANTMFKLTYQAFVMSYLAGGYIIVRQIALEKYAYIRRFLTIFWMVILYSILSYAQISTNSYYGRLKTYLGLDGIKWLQNQYPDQYQIVYWLKKNAEKNSVILEAPGDSYTDYNAISAYTGIPTVSGWFVHEWLWRGTPDFPQQRVTDITNIYLTPDAKLAKELLNKYQVNYIIVGTFERQKYPLLNEEKFTKIASIAFQTGVTTVYKLN